LRRPRSTRCSTSTAPCGRPVGTPAERADARDIIADAGHTATVSCRPVTASALKSTRTPTS
jgi:hypothetical protein